MDDNPTVLRILDQPLGFEPPERFTHGRLGDAPLGRYLLLAEVLATHDAPGEDAALEGVIDGIGLGTGAGALDGHRAIIRARPRVLTLASG